MTDEERVGTALERRQQRRFWTLMLGGAAMAVVIGLTGRRLMEPSGTFTPVAAILLAAALTLLMVVITWMYFRTADELEWANNLNAYFWGFNAFLLGWPVWLILWKGGIVPEPDMPAIYLGSAGIALVAYLWNKFR